MTRLAVLALLLAFVAGCTDDRSAASAAPAGAAPTGDTFTKGGGFTPFYGEAKHDGRMYLYGNEFAYKKFMKSKEVNELAIKKFIGEGPEGMTLVVELDKDSPSMTDRLITTCKARYNIQ